MRITTLFITLLIGATGFAASTDFSVGSKRWERPAKDLHVINVTDLTDKELDTIMQGKNPLIAVEFSQGTVVPIGFFLKGNLIQLSENQVNCGQLTILQTFYVRNVQDQLILSSDLLEWKPFMEFITGTASVALNIQNYGPRILFGAEINRRP